MGYESTGGQFSPTTPAGYVTNSSPYGMVEPPFDPCDVVKAAGATFVAETTATQWHQTVTSRSSTCASRATRTSARMRWARGTP